MYSAVTMASKHSGSHERIEKMDPKIMFPITYWNLAYVDESNNCEHPVELLGWAQDVWNAVNGKLFERVELPNFNSAVTQLYGLDTVLADHYDRGVTYGFSVSLGSSCKFNFENEVIDLNGGDIMITDFSKVLHGIPHILNNTPGWLTDGIYEIDGVEYPIKTFDRTRLSIQIKYVDRTLSPPPVPLEQFYELLESYKVK